ncbi:hypothetical protein ABK040_007588 [Willaertia magna]
MSHGSKIANRLFQGVNQLSLDLSSLSSQQPNKKLCIGDQISLYAYIHGTTSNENKENIENNHRHASNNNTNNNNQSGIGYFSVNHSMLLDDCVRCSLAVINNNNKTQNNKTLHSNSTSTTDNHHHEEEEENLNNSGMITPRSALHSIFSLTSDSPTSLVGKFNNNNTNNGNNRNNSPNNTKNEKAGNKQEGNVNNENANNSSEKASEEKMSNNTSGSNNNNSVMHRNEFFQVQDYKEMIFVVHPMNSYSAMKAYKKKLNHLGLEDFDETKGNTEGLKQDDFNQLLELKKKVEIEIQHNKLESERYFGKPVVFGQIIQLYHLQTGKYLTLNRENAEVQKECMSLTLSEIGSSDSYFNILSFYRFKSEGEVVKLNDHIRLQSKKTNQFLHYSPISYSFDENRREINMINSFHLNDETINQVKFCIKLYTSFLTEEKSEKYLKSGDIVRIYHKELDSYLIVNSETKRVKFQKLIETQNNSFKQEEYDYFMNCNTLWEFQLFDPFQGGTLNWSGYYRIKHVATGLYLNVKAQEADDDEIEKPYEKINSFSNHNGLESGSDNSDELDDAARSGSETPLRGNRLMRSHSVTSAGKWKLLKSKLTNNNTLQSNNNLSALSLDGSDNNNRKSFNLFVSELNNIKSLFSFIPPELETETDISLTSLFKIKHITTDTFLHGIKSVNMKDNDERASVIFHKCVSLSETFNEDVFSISKVDLKEINDLLYVQSALPILKYFKLKFASIEGINFYEEIPKDDYQQLINVLGRLIKFCSSLNTLDNNDKALLIKRKWLVKDIKIIDTVMSLISIPFEKIKSVLESLSTKEPSKLSEKEGLLLSVIQTGYKLIRTVCEQNVHNGVYMLKYINFMTSHVEQYNLGSADALFYVLKDNYLLLQQISSYQLSFFTKLLTEFEKKEAVYLSFLSALCNFNDKPATRNQDRLCKLLFTDKDVVSKVFIIPYMVDNKIVVKDFDHNEISLTEIFESLNNRELDKATLTRRKQMVHYLEAQFQFFADLCFERNSQTIKVISELLSFDLLLNCLKEETLYYDLRNVICNLLLFVYIDVDPYVKKDTRILVRDWNNMEEEKVKIDKNIENLKEFLQNFFSNVKIDLGTGMSSKNALILNYIILYRRMIELGMLNEVGEIEELLECFLLILDPSNDICSTKRKDIDNYKVTKENSVIADIRIELCRVFHFILDSENNRIVTEIIKVFKNNIDNTATTNTADNVGVVDKENILKQIDCQIDLFSSEKLHKILIALTNYEYLGYLSVHSLALLQRLFKRREELMNLLSEILLLNSVEESQNYFNLKIQQQILSSNLNRDVTYTNKISAITTKKIHETLKKINELTNVSCFQENFKHLKLYEEFIKILQLDYNYNEKSELYDLCVSILIKFVIGNTSVQFILYQYFDKLISKIRNSKYIVDLLCEIVRNNREICCIIEERSIRSFINIMAEIGISLNKKFINFLRLLVTIKGVPIKRNQEIVTNALLERKNSLLVLYVNEHDPFGGLRERDALIEKKEHETDVEGNSPITYHIYLLYLLGALTRGKISETELKLQHLLPLNISIAMFTNSQLPLTLEYPLLQLLDELYINTEKAAHIKSVNKIWKVFAKIANQLEFYLKDKSSLQGGDYPENDDDVSNWVNPLRYVFDCIIPCVQHFFHLHFPTDVMKPSYFNIIDKLLDLLLQLHQQSNDLEKEDIMKCIQSMLKTSMPQTITKKIKMFIQNDIIQKAKQKVGTLKRGIPKKVDKVKEEENVKTKFMSFIKVAKSALEDSLEFDKLAKLYSEMPENNLVVLVNVIKRMITLVNSDVLSIDFRCDLVTIILSALHTIETMIKEVHETENQELIDEIHHKIARIQIQRLVIDCFTSKNNDIVERSLKLGIVILYEGNTIVQTAIYETFKDFNSEPFFIAVRDRIRKSIIEIKEKKKFKKRMATLEEKPYMVKAYALKKVKEEETSYLSKKLTFNETGHIKLIMRFLQLLCEGHNTTLQNVLREQTFNNHSVDLVNECLQYTIALEKYLSMDNIDIANQAFITLTEFIQGPCHENQLALGMSPKLYYISNKIISNDFLRDITLESSLSLKYLMVLMLSSLIEGSSDNQIIDLMKNSLNIESFQILILQCANILSNGKESIVHQERLESRIRSDIVDYKLYDKSRGLVIDNINELKIDIKDNFNELGYQIYVLLLTLADRCEKFQFDQKRVITEFFHENKSILEVFDKMTGRIEIVRDNKLERIYFPIPNVCHYLRNHVRNDFVYECDQETAQERIREVYENLTQFKQEMDHYASFDNKKKLTSEEEKEDNKAISSNNVDSHGHNHDENDNETNNSFNPFINFYESIKSYYNTLYIAYLLNPRKANVVHIGNNWENQQQMAFIISIILNVIILFSYEKIYDIHFAGKIPIPGLTDENDFIVDERIRLISSFSTSNLRLLAQFVGFCQMINYFFLLGFYLYFFTSLRVRKYFGLKINERWENIPRDSTFYKNYIYHTAKDPNIWFFIANLIFSFLGLVFSPSFYSINLFGVIFRFSTLFDVVRSITLNFKRLIFTGFLLIITLYFFSMIFFVFSYDDFIVSDTNQMLCLNTLDCFKAVVNYGLRSGGGWDIFPVRTSDLRFTLDLTFWLVVVVVLTNVVFGIILSSFDDLRSKREQIEDRVKNRCFICDIERSRFDMKANQGMNFLKHSFEEHNLWNYVYFLIYLYNKEKTEFTGAEQYVFDQTLKDDLNFFPILRSLTLETLESSSPLNTTTTTAVTSTNLSTSAFVATNNNNNTSMFGTMMNNYNGLQEFESQHYLREQDNSINQANSSSNKLFSKSPRNNTITSPRQTIPLSPLLRQAALQNNSTIRLFIKLSEKSTIDQHYKTIILKENELTFKTLREEVKEKLFINDKYLFKIYLVIGNMNSSTSLAEQQQHSPTTSLSFEQAEISTDKDVLSLRDNDKLICKKL